MAESEKGVAVWSRDRLSTTVRLLERLIDVRSEWFDVDAAREVAEGVAGVSVEVIGRGFGDETSGTEAERCVFGEAAKFASASRALGWGKLSMEVD